MSHEQIAIDVIRRKIKGTEWENQVFLAGGYVRDEILGKASKDVDLIITRENGGIEFANWMITNCRSFTSKTAVTFPRFGTAKFSMWVGTTTQDRKEVHIECVMPRTEIYMESNGRHPDVAYCTLEEDAKQRDFTVNALFKNVSTGEIVDFVGGRQDIENGLIRSAIDPEVIFKDDPLRMLRAIRFANRFRWRMHWSIFRAIQRDAQLIETISAERIQDEISKMLLVARPSLAIRNLRATGLLKYIWPEIEDMGGVTQNHYHIDDVFTHSMKVLDGTPAHLTTRLAGLFHDVGKPACRAVVDGKVKFKGHDETGSVLVDYALRRLKFSNEIVDAVGYVVHDHMRLKGEDDTASDVTDKTLRKLRKDAGDNLTVLLDVMHADNMAHAPEHTTPNRIPNIRARLENMKEIPAKPTLPVNGNDVMRIRGISPGPQIKIILAAVEDAWLANPNLTRAEAEDIIDAFGTVDWG